MKIVIDIDEEDYKRIQDIPDVFNSLTSRAYSAIRNGISFPDGAEILTKEAYSDLCARAAEKPEKHTEERTKTHACDCISRQAVLDTEYQIKEINGIEYVMLSEVQMKIRKMSPVTPQPKIERWIRRNSFLVPYKCSECNYESERYDNYCPNCGARMIESQEGEDKV